MSNISINIPEKINVGFQNSSGTYTGKLAYVIYYDNKGKLRKETSWENWRDKNIPNEEYENIPTEGFVLNKKVGDYVSDWNHRQAYTRVYDPRGFEFEITIENLLYILEYTNSIVGKGLEGEFVYGWDGKDLILVPVGTPDYKEIREIAEIRANAVSFTAKTMKVGAVYLNKNLEEVIFVGRFDYYDYTWGENRIDFTEFNTYESQYKKKPKRYWFAEKRTHRYGDKKGESYYYLFSRTGLKDYLIDIVNEAPHEDYPFIFEKLEVMVNYSPPDFTKNVIEDLSIVKVKDILKAKYEGLITFTVVNCDEDDGTKNIRKEFYFKDDMVYFQKVNPNRKSHYWNHRNQDDEPYYICETIGTIKEFYDKYKPKKLLIFLENGKQYREVF